ncbi:MAG TPA: type II toxin-antitoxin system prevent-host-death family antitoxin [Rhodanobacteraceae bacterium]|nr:type II toxin-antitoxin system prevent-host-death family antitoxin [Rhodanobacteraceae bacterium]
METQIGSYEAKTRLPELLRAVRRGKAFTITNRGEEVARLVPARTSKSGDADCAAEEMKIFMRAQPVRGVNIKALREEGRA